MAKNGREFEVPPCMDPRIATLHSVVWHKDVGACGHHPNNSDGAGCVPSYLVINMNDDEEYLEDNPDTFSCRDQMSRWCPIEELPPLEKDKIEIDEPETQPASFLGRLRKFLP